MSLSELIRQEHDEYRRYFAKLNKTTPKEAQTRAEIATEFQKKLYAHHAAEEIAVFPKTLQIPELKDLTLELETEHNTMKQLFDNLTKDYNKTNWRYKLAPLYDIMHAHWLKEEETMIPFAPDYFTKNQLDDLAEKYQQATQQYLQKH